MGMSDENIVYIGKLDVFSFQYLQYAVSTTCIHYHGSIFIFNGEAGIITLHGLCVAGFEYKLGKTFTLSLEGYYRFFFNSESKAQTFAAMVAMGWKF